MEPTGRHKKFVYWAVNTAQYSPMDIRHGAVLVKGKAIIQRAHNTLEYCQFGMRHLDHSGLPCRHAELACINNLKRNTTKGAMLYVVRIGSENELKMSKPCPMCEAALRVAGVKRVFYSDESGELSEMRL
tara:strand:+ start:2339 stop:2728 length:390 start_codon:yes stop_codon:yes gene_type:complete